MSSQLLILCYSFSVKGQGVSLAPKAWGGVSLLNGYGPGVLIRWLQWE